MQQVLDEFFCSFRIDFLDRKWLCMHSWTFGSFGQRLVQSRLKSEGASVTARLRCSSGYSALIFALNGISDYGL